MNDTIPAHRRAVEAPRPAIRTVDGKPDIGRQEQAPAPAPETAPVVTETEADTADADKRAPRRK